MRQPLFPKNIFKPTPDDETTQVFKNLLEKFKECPLCGSSFEFANMRDGAEFIMKCGEPYELLKTEGWSVKKTRKDHSFSVKITQTRRIHNDIVYNTKEPSFFINYDGWAINYYNKYPFKVNLSRFDQPKYDSKNGYGLFMSIDEGITKLKVSFGSLEKWFCSREQLSETLDKYKILL